MCRKLIYLISFVLVLALAGNALADDLAMPYWTGAEGSSWAIWTFDEDSGVADTWFPEEYIGDEENHMGSGNTWNGEGFENPDFAAVANMSWGEAVWSDVFESRQGVVGPFEETVGIINNYPRNEAKFKRIRIQMTYYTVGDPYGVFVECETADEGAGNYWPGWRWYDWTTAEYGLGDWPVTDLGGGWYHVFMEIDMHDEGEQGFPLNPGAEVFFAGGDIIFIDQFIVDTICYEGDDPPAGPGRGADMSDGLLVWHDFDNLFDGTGNGHNAVLSGDAYISGGLLYLDGTEDYADIGTLVGFGPVNPLVDALSDFTIAVAYACTSTATGDSGSMLVSVGPAAAMGSGDLTLSTSNDGQLIDHWWTGLFGSDQSGVGYADGTVHLAIVTYEEATDTYTFYHLDGGAAVAHGSGGDLDWSEQWDEASDYGIRLGSHRNATLKADEGIEFFPDLDGQIDMFAIWNRALATSEMPEIAEYSPEVSGNAHSPSPANGATDVYPKVILSWTPGPFADKHDVYFGTDETKVTDANRANTLGVLVSQDQDPNRYPAADTLNLDFGQTYYWRIDEVADPCMWTGNVWNFTTTDHLVVDDIESYGEGAVPGEPGSKICFTWKDGQGWRKPRPPYKGNGTGSIIGHDDPPYVETVITHGGGQSMPYYYDNDAKKKEYYSEASANTLDLPIGSKDWSELKALSLWFYGFSNNDANEQMYVALDDGTESVAVVEYDGDMNDIKIEEWHEWNIALQDFNDLGVNLADVNNIYIGFGIRGNTNPGGTPGGSGKVYFDDIRLYPTRCVPRYGPYADLTDDCVVDYKDLRIMAGDWLDGDATAEEPPRENLVVEYTFDTDFIDTSNNGYHGIDHNSPSVHDGILTLDGTNFVDIPFDGNNPFDGSQDFSIVMEFRTDQSSILISSARDNTPDNHSMAVYMLTNEDEGEVVYDNFWIAAAGAGGETATGRNPGDGEWHIFAVTYDAVEDFIDIHLWDGEDWSWQGWWDPNIPAIEEDTVRIGGSLNAEFPYELDVGDFVGDFDGIRIYDKVLTESEILWLADTTDPKYSPLVSVANLYDEEPENSKMINFKDFAVMADQWLLELLWP